MSRKIRSQRLHQPAPKPAPAAPLDLLWKLDESPPEVAWRLAWWSGTAPIWFCLEQAEASCWTAASLGPEVGLFDVLDDIQAGSLRSPTEAYETVKALSKVLRATAGWPIAYVEWLAAGALCAEAMIANSSGGGLLYGTLLEQVHHRCTVTGSPESASDCLLRARERDAFGPRWGPALGSAVDGFRCAWRAGRYRTAYLLARAARGLP